MKYRIWVDPAARAYARRLDVPTQVRIRARLRELAADPATHSKLLTNAGGRRASRVGEYRIVFTIDQGQGRLNLLAIAPRGRVYRDL